MSYIASKIFMDNLDNAKKFDRIHEYFGSMTEEDMIEMDLFIFVEYAEPKEKGLMLLFVSRYLNPYLDEWNDSRKIYPS